MKGRIPVILSLFLMVLLLRRIHRELGVTVWHITHNRTEAQLLAQMQLVLSDGAVREVRADAGSAGTRAC